MDTPPPKIRADKKYTVFISSTYKDLIKPRERLVWACLEGGDIPLGMETFPASSDNAWTVIQRTIFQSDFYVVVSAWRYGELVPGGGGLSYTEREYEYAKELKKPIIGLLKSEDAEVLPKDIDQEPENKKRLAAFKERLRDHHYTLWKNEDELASHYHSAMRASIATHAQPGWVRSTEAASPEVANQLAELMKERNRLQSELDKAGGDGKERERQDLLIAELKSIPHVCGDNVRTLWDFFCKVAPSLRIQKAWYHLVDAANLPNNQCVIDGINFLDSYDLVEVHRNNLPVVQGSSNLRGKGTILVDDPEFALSSLGVSIYRRLVRDRANRRQDHGDAQVEQ